jgi:polar amino acid transport system substrate-binding protein
VNVYAENTHVKSTHVKNKTVEMVAGLTKPPFIIEESDNGMQLDIIRAAFAKVDHTVNFIYIPINRHFGIYDKWNIDGVITLPEFELRSDMFLSIPYIDYQNIVVTLADSHLNVDSFSDLTNIKVAAFQNASKYLQVEFTTAVASSNSYVEVADQYNQLAMLYAKRVDAIVLDINIFKHLLAEKLSQSSSSKASSNKYKQKVHFHSIFTHINYVAGFKSKKVRDEFNEGINKIRVDGSYQKIIDSYLKPK